MPTPTAAVPVLVRQCACRLPRCGTRSLPLPLPCRCGSGKSYGKCCSRRCVAYTEKWCKTERWTWVTEERPVRFALNPSDIDFDIARRLIENRDLLAQVSPRPGSRGATTMRVPKSVRARRAAFFKAL